MAGCASGPKLGQETQLQSIVNRLEPIPIGEKKLKFKFGGDAWIATVDGKNFLAGTLTLENNAEGSILTLKQTHVYSTEKKPVVGGDVGWIKTPGPQIVLEYKKGPPETFSAKASVN
jgi:hypothetical protein